MKILFWTEQFWPSIGGIEVRCQNLGEELSRRGHEVCVVTSHGSHDVPDEDTINGIAVQRFGFLEALSTNRLDLFASERHRLVALKKSFRPDVAHVMLTDPTVLFHLQTEKAYPAPTVVTIPIGIDKLKGGADTLLHRTLRGAAWTIGISGFSLNEVRKVVPEIAERSSVIYNSINEPSVSPSPLPFDPPHLLCLGRVVEEKGFDIAIDAVSRMKRDQFPGITMTIAGDGPAREMLEAQASTSGLDSAVRFTGWVKPGDVADLINTATLMIVPSRWDEAFGNVAVQAMQMGRPVIGSDAGGIPEVVTDGVTGYIFPREDSGRLASMLESLLNDRQRARALGDAGSEKARTVFPFARHVDEHEQLYQKIIHDHQPRTDALRAESR